MGHENADTENNECTCYRRKHVISSPHATLNGGQDAQSKRFADNRGGFLQADEFEPHRAWPVFQAISAKMIGGQDVRPSQMTPELGKSACARQRLDLPLARAPVDAIHDVRRDVIPIQPKCKSATKGAGFGRDQSGSQSDKGASRTHSADVDG